MASVTTPPTKQARSIFTDLGYTVTGNGDEFRAERKWRQVRVTAVANDAPAPETGTLRCFVTWRENAAQLNQELHQADLEYEWAVIGVAENGEYEVMRAPPGPQTAV